MKRLKIGAISALLVLGLLVGSAGAAGSGVLHEASLQLSGDLTLTVTRPTPTDQWLTSGIEPATTEQ